MYIKRTRNRMIVKICTMTMQYFNKTGYIFRVYSKSVMKMSKSSKLLLFSQKSLFGKYSLILANSAQKR